jgi:transposase-like protein
MGRRKRRHFSGTEKVGILKRHHVDGESVSAICEELKLNPTMFYEWQRKFFENGAKAFEKDEKREDRKLEERNQVLEARLKRREEVIAELMTEHLALKKSLGED